jgi:hypothetical protein
MKTLLLSFVVISSFITCESSFAGIEAFIRLGKAYYRSKSTTKSASSLSADYRQRLA